MTINFNAILFLGVIVDKPLLYSFIETLNYAIEGLTVLGGSTVEISLTDLAHLLLLRIQIKK